jgi:hypothetical protein
MASGALQKTPALNGSSQFEFDSPERVNTGFDATANAL